MTLSPARLVRRLRALLSRSRFDRDLDEEMQLHVDQLIARFRAGGLDETEARLRALREFGAIEQLREQARDARGVRPIEDFGRDLKIGLRALRHRPAFTAVLVITLGVGMGGSTAIFGVVNGILLKPLPYREADRLAVVWQHDRKTGDDRQEVAPANFLDWRERSRAFECLTATEPFGLDWRSPEGPIYLPTALVYEGFFDVFETSPLLGRGFRPDEYIQGRSDVVVLGYSLWRTRFGGTDDIIGRVLTLDGRPHTVVGVMPEGFSIPSDDVVWAPKVLQGWEKQSRTSNFYSVYGRLRPDVTIDQAAADLAAIAEQLSREYVKTNASVGVALVPLVEQIVGTVRKALWLLFGGVVLVLAVVTANVASMQLARAAARGREFAVRAALGAGVGRVARQLLAENVLLGVCGTALGFGLAWVGIAALRSMAPVDLPRTAELRADGGMLLFATILGFVTVVLTGIGPTLIAARARLQTALGQGGRGLTSARFMARTQAALVVFQFAASLVLLVGAGLLIRSFVLILTEDRGFRTEGVAIVTVQSWSYYTTPAARAQFVQDVEGRLSSLPGITAVGMTSSVPLMETISAEQAPLTIVGEPALVAGQNAPLVQFAVATTGFFQAFGIPLRQGRWFDSHDHADTQPVAVVNETFVRRYLSTGSPIGRRIALANLRGGPQTGPMNREIVGVVADVRRLALHEAPRPTVYIPHAQLPVGANAFVVWGAGRPADLLGQLKQAIGEANPIIPIHNQTTMAELVGDSLRHRRFLLAILGGFAVMALDLAAAGLFGLMSFVTAQRTREFGIRMALGAERRHVVSLVLTRGLMLATVGIALGLVGCLELTQFLASMLYRVTPIDPMTFVIAAAVLASTAILASLIPAWRASGTDPIAALREE